MRVEGLQCIAQGGAIRCAGVQEFLCPSRYAVECWRGQIGVEKVGRGVEKGLREFGGLLRSVPSWHGRAARVHTKSSLSFGSCDGSARVGADGHHVH